MGDTDVAARIALLRQLAGEEVVQLGAEDTVSDELALLADLTGHFGGTEGTEESMSILRHYRLSEMIELHPAPQPLQNSKKVSGGDEDANRHRYRPSKLMGGP